MPTSIGLYVYKFEVFEKFGRNRIAFDDKNLPSNVENIFQAFFEKHRSSTIDEDEQRVWYFQDPIRNEEGETDCYIRYGTYGFESELFNSKTQKKAYERQVDDYENISLLFQSWFPVDENFGLILFQSFGGKSCSKRVRSAFAEYFNQQNPEYTLRYKKLLPQNLKGSKIFDAPVKGLSFIKKNISGDRFDAYGKSEVPENVDVEVIVHAKRKGNWGSLGKLTKEKLRDQASLLFLDEGQAFDGASAFVEIGNKKRKIAVLGLSSEAGTIDITEDVKFAPNGHPKQKELIEICNEILSDFRKAID